MRTALQRTALIALLIPFAAFGQSTGGVRGRVSTAGADNEGTYLSKIEVRLQCERDAPTLRTATTDDIGQFLFSDIPAGRCTVKVDDPQLEKVAATVDVVANQVTEVDLQLRLRALQQNITVTADQTRVDTSSSDTAAPPISQTTLQSAPLIDERFQDALPLLPGVVRGPDGLMNIKGARASQSGTLVNSASGADPVTGEQAISLPLEAVASVKVLSSPFSAEYGQFAGGVTEVETRSGTDEWKYLVNNFFPRFRSRGGDFQGVESVTPRFTFAGPISKGKLYLFQSFDYRFVYVPVPSLPPLQSDQQFETFDSATQVDWSISERHHLSANFDLYPEIAKYAQLNTFNPQPVTPSFHQHGDLLSFHESAVMGQDLLETSFSVKRADMDVYPSSKVIGSLTLYPEQNFGTWYNQENRSSWLYQGSQVFHKNDLKALGTHLLSIGYEFDSSNYEGNVTNQPVIVLRENHTTSQVVTFGDPASLSASSNNIALYVQDHWSPNQRVSLDLGVRAEHDGLASSDLVGAPRLGFVIAPTSDNRTAVRGGVGLFYDKIPLNVPTFLSYPAETVTEFAVNGVTALGEPTTFTHSLAAPGLRLPYSVSWSLQVDREINQAVTLRLGYEGRSTRRDFLVEPVAASADSPAALELLNNGRQRYHEFQATVRWQPSAHHATVYASFVRSYAHGDLNTFGQFFGNFPYPIIRPNQFGALPYDAPNRFLLWGTLALPFKIQFSPVLDVHTGFPYSQVDDNLNFVGQRDSQRFPAFASLDSQILRPFRVTVLNRKHTLKAGIKIFNATSHFNPRDVQNNIFSPHSGALYNSVGALVRGKLEFDF